MTDAEVTSESCRGPSTECRSRGRSALYPGSTAIPVTVAQDCRGPVRTGPGDCRRRFATRAFLSVSMSVSERRRSSVVAVPPVLPCERGLCIHNLPAMDTEFAATPWHAPPTPPTRDCLCGRLCLLWQAGSGRRQPRTHDTHAQPRGFCGFPPHCIRSRHFHPIPYHPICRANEPESAMYLGWRHVTTWDSRHRSRTDGPDHPRSPPAANTPLFRVELRNPHGKRDVVRSRAPTTDGAGSPTGRAPRRPLCRRSPSPQVPLAAARSLR